MEINQITLTEFRTEFAELVKPLESKKGIQISMGRIRFNDSGFKFRVEVVNASNKEEAQKISFGKYCANYGLTKEDYNKEIKYNNNTYNLIGFKPKSTKYPLLVQTNGKRYKLPFNQKMREILGLKKDMGTELFEEIEKGKNGI